ncbi:dTDP-4-dehydrorhamnose reductase [Aquimarina sp. 2201CG14-23]|uniref:dTDP-4-dehydrorhamnose reductase n=1 Tax=Aquimarina mycalae TaxID=3040073 RepID=UPI002477E80E|nr:dTDP-4-dehydrorhamnose reductase [Aquimarina sp. 2201CG14-23]MDH7446361.1 dTDP-4-dehydrorhamnose reductase [Aquimarina sp. 2201CG14-23]
MKNIVVTGGNGQLASCIKDIENKLVDFKFIYVDYEELDITKKEQLNAFFKNQEIAYCINCAAYTAVDKAETEAIVAKNVNEIGAQYLAETCKENNTVLIQISTDFVFDGKKATLYTEEDATIPLGIYGLTKLNGELATRNSLEEHFIIRTSWLYSEHGNNFLKTMLRLGDERDEISVVCDQIGTPTYAGDLAEVIVKLVKEENNSFGTYHYSNEGVASWYDFAKAIFEESNAKIKLLPIKSEAYPTPAERPCFSVMDKSKIKKTLNFEIPYWRDSLKKCLTKL